MSSRSVIKKVTSIEQAEGVGARVRRSIGSQVRSFNPFLMLDHFKMTKKGAGFPDHPHRGMTTLTYVLGGESYHEDFLGNRGKLGPGDVQFMIAGRGIMHSEIPVMGKDGSPAEGLQLWIDLPSKKKMVEPSYQDMNASSIPKANPTDHVEIKVVCGEADGNAEQGVVKSPVRPLGGCWFLDYHLDAAAVKAFQRIPQNWNAFIYVIDGEVKVAGKTTVKQHQTAFLSNDPVDGTGVELQSISDRARLIIVAGEPLDQQVVQHGPFVVDAPEKIQKAFMDFTMGRNGFEGAPSWKSQIREVMKNPHAEIDLKRPS